ncbi:MAG: DUF560 domain-containing protein [Alphaproteobacteria bacterium]|nr:MAG: DUF560 domain-containing protein [Alphaproteobacteria bacterium]
MYQGSNRTMAGISALALAMWATGATAQDIGPGGELDQLSAAAESPDEALSTAATQEAEGDLLGAASTLERALLHRPEADDVRLAYATLLCRLDDQQAARIEVGALRLRPTGGEAWQQMLQACGDDFSTISRRTGRISGTVGVGLAYQEDAFGEISAISYFPPQSRDGMAFIANAQINARVPTGDMFLYGDLYAQNHTDISGPNSDYQFGDAAIGIGTENGHSEFSAGGVIRHGRIAGDSYFTAYGGEANTSFRVGANGRISLRGEAVKEDYEDNELDGWHYSALAGYQFFPSLDQSFSITAGVERKDAKFDFFGFVADYGYDAFSLAGAAKVPLGSTGVYGKASATFRHLNYHDSDGKEKRLYGRVAVGVPLVKRSLFVEAGATYRLRDHNFDFIEDYSSFGGDLRLVWNF